MRVLVLATLIFLGACKSEKSYDPEKDNIDYVELKRRVDNVLAEIDSGKWGSDYNLVNYYYSKINLLYERLSLKPNNKTLVRSNFYKHLNMSDCYIVLANGNEAFSMRSNSGKDVSYISNHLMWKNKVEQGDRIYFEKEYYMDTLANSDLTYDSERILEIEALFSINYLCGFNVREKRELFRNNLKYSKERKIKKFVTKYNLNTSEFFNELQKYLTNENDDSFFLKFEHITRKRIQSEES